MALLFIACCIALPFIVIKHSNTNIDANNVANDYEIIQEAEVQSGIISKESVENSDFIFFDSDKRYLTEDEVKNLSAETIRLAINEIYARRGRFFDTPELKEYFESKSWYNPQYSKSKFDESVFNEYETANINLLAKYR